MRTPPLLIGAALVFWGWQTELLLPAAGMAVVLEAARWMRRRLHFGLMEFYRLWDLTALLFIGAAVFQYSSNQISSAVLTFLQWQPLIFFLFIAAQAYSAQEEIDRRTFFWLLRRKPAPEAADPGLNVAYPYFALCLLATSAVNTRDLRFYTAVCGLVGYALWMERPRRVPAAMTVGLFLAAVWLGYLGSIRLHEWQAELENKTARWLYGFVPRDYEEFEGFTTMGRIGSLKLSGRIVLAVEPEVPRQPPRLLRQVSFTRYGMGTWYAIQRHATRVAEDGEASWTLLPGRRVPHSLALIATLTGGRGLLTLPLEAARITELPVAEMERNRLGVVRVAQGPEMVRFRVHYGPGASRDGPPDRRDLEIPDLDTPALAQVLQELNLQGQPPDQALKILTDFFQNRFQYTPYVRLARYNAEATDTPLRQFLLNKRAGHCEYFATATVLLLRKLGIPARYATGFVVPESARRGKRYLVRERDAHAWTLVFLNGQWHDFDTTPAVWEQAEGRLASIFRPVSDWWSELQFRFAAWRWVNHPGKSRPYYLIGLLAMLAGVLGWRLLRGRRSLRRHAPAEKPAAARTWPGLDSEFYLIEARLRQLGLERQPAETLCQWLDRIGAHPPAAGATDALQSLVRLHYRYRFDPQGLDAAERASLAAQARAWLAINPTGNPPAKPEDFLSD